MEYWEKIKERYDVAFIGAAATILIGIAFIFFTIVVSDWMFPKNKGRNWHVENDISGNTTTANDTATETSSKNCTKNGDVNKTESSLRNHIDNRDTTTDLSLGGEKDNG